MQQTAVSDDYKLVLSHFLVPAILKYCGNLQCPSLANRRRCDLIAFADTATMDPKKRKVEQDEVDQEEAVGTLREMFPNAPLRVIKVIDVEGVVYRF